MVKTLNRHAIHCRCTNIHQFVHLFIKAPWNLMDNETTSLRSLPSVATCRPRCPPLRALVFLGCVRGIACCLVPVVFEKATMTLPHIGDTRCQRWSRFLSRLQVTEIMILVGSSWLTLITALFAEGTFDCWALNKFDEESEVMDIWWDVVHPCASHTCFAKLYKPVPLKSLRITSFVSETSLPLFRESISSRSCDAKYGHTTNSLQFAQWTWKFSHSVCWLSWTMLDSLSMIGEFKRLGFHDVQLTVIYSETRREDSAPRKGGKEWTKINKESTTSENMWKLVRFTGWFKYFGGLTI